MRKLIPKIAAVLFGIVFLLGGASEVFGADSFYFTYYSKDSQGRASGAVMVSDAYAVRYPDCDTALLAKQKAGFGTSAGCTSYPSLAAAQTAAATLTAQNSNQATTAARATGKPESDPILKKLNCNPVGSVIGGIFGGSGNFADCIPITVYYLAYKPASWIFIGSGFVFDAMLSLSIDSSFINQSFITSTWGVVRDFSNMLFIFILIYAGVQTILGMGDWKKTVLMVVVMALLINFSLFFTKVVIDAGNVLAVGIYNGMGSEKPIANQNFSVARAVPERDISGSIAGAFHPEKFLKVAGDVSALDATVVFIIAAIVTGYAGYIFFQAAILFVRRLVVFWGLMILSPFAFISIALPGKANKFSEWLHELINQTFVVPVFLFLVYIIMRAISAGDGILGSMLKNPDQTATGLDFKTILMPIMIAALIIKALQETLKFAEGMAGSTGASLSNLVGGALGIAAGGALGAATGGLGLVGRGVGGRLAQNLAERGTFTQMATNEKGNAFSRFAGRQFVGLNEKARTGTWDITGTSVGKATLGKAASSIGAKLAGPGESAKGGFAGEMKRQDLADRKFAEKLQLGTQEKEAIHEKVEKSKETLKEKETIVKAADTNLESVEKEAREFMMNSSSGAQLDSGIALKLAAAKKAKEDAEKAFEEASQATTKTAEKLIEEEEDRRRREYAKFVEERGKIIGAAAGMVGTAAGAVGIAAAGPLGAAAYAAGVAAGIGSYSNEQARRTAEKLRKGGESAKVEEKKLEDYIKEEIEKGIKAKEGH